MSDHAVLVVEAVERAGIIGAVEEAVHFVLVQIDEAYIAVAVLIVDVIGTRFAVGSFFLFHDNTSKCHYVYLARIVFVPEFREHFKFLEAAADIEQVSLVVFRVFSHSNGLYLHD